MTKIYNKRTDKGIIIDDVDVAKCYFYYNGECRCELNCIDLYKNETIVKLAQRSPHHNYMECKPSNDCYFKQLQRAKQENARLKEEIKDLNFYIDSYRQVWETNKYKQALEELRGILDKACKQYKNKYLSKDYCSGQGDCYAIKQVIDEV